MSLTLAIAVLTTPVISCRSGSIETECSRADVAKKIALVPDRIAKIADTCLYDFGGRCAVEASGRIEVPERGGTLLWQKASLAPRDGPGAWMVVIVARDATGKAALAGFAESSGSIGTPDLVASDGTRSLVHVTGTLAGSGGGNADALFIGEGDKAAWGQVDMEGWYDDGSKMLPKGYWLRGPAKFIFAEMMAVIPVARDGDGNCCPRGGQGLFDLEIRDGKLLLTGVRFQPMQPVGEAVEYPAPKGE
ncbi:hypothetical protein BWQ93_09745 [Sphingopyxis sp. QXT-31]|uniref:hypothetical protein n=1 Tax=Sphingopyxis sp. QXT-31 TaxID=1357916 RepID=UPI0009792907|nr:hypothetical protein [Sphingopyxis sp. QXT-31]APZ98746.1 hypothetical protein BWQ93_09745 [Sphingopyxis sp. QXT-31]